MTGDRSPATPLSAADSEMIPVTRSLGDELLSATYRVSRDAFWDISRMQGDDGYDVMQRARTHRWRAIPAWGRDGWDLGAWPLVVIYHRTTNTRIELAYYVEGDVDLYRYPSRELRDRATDCLAFWHWRQAGEEWVAGIDRVEDAPAHLRGPFSWKRLDISKEEH
jgi:hypothetical protein